LENITYYLPFGKEIFGFGKKFGTLHLENISHSLSERNLIDLNFFDLEFKQKI